MRRPRGRRDRRRRVDQRELDPVELVWKQRPIQLDELGSVELRHFRRVLQRRLRQHRRKQRRRIQLERLERVHTGRPTVFRCRGRDLWLGRPVGELVAMRERRMH